MKDQEETLPSLDIRKITLYGLGALVFLVLFFLLWSLLAPLESAAIAPGEISVKSHKKSIQHLEGGIVKSVFVKDGEVVEENQPLIKLDDTQAKTRLNLLRQQSFALMAEEARLIAERDKKDEIDWPERLIENKALPLVSNAMKTQNNIFISNLQTFEGQVKILNQRIEQLNKQIESLRAQVKALETQLEYIKKEIVSVEYLDKRGLIEKPRLYALKREEAKLEGSIGQNKGQIALAEQKIGETQQQILTLKDERNKEILSTLKEAHQEFINITEREIAADDILQRTLITAPQKGVVVGLNQHTIGGVIKSGETVLEIIPYLDDMIIEAQVNPLDIDVVHQGLMARVKLTSLKQRSQPLLTGEVTYVSADSFINEITKRPYYKAWITLDPKSLKELKNINLYSGMPVEVFIISDRRTAFNYFISPVIDSFNRAFREQ